jgi:hypothetical protein
MYDFKNFFSSFPVYHRGALYGKTLPAPIVPAVAGATDTSNFDPYPESKEEAALPTYSGKDPFEGF